MGENVKVIVRCRPMNKKEIDLNSKCCVTLKDCVAEIWDPGEGAAFPKRFTFDSVYNQESCTETVYNEICYPLVESVLEGYNCTIFVYGQTGCGKSFTMEGNKCQSEKGVISRAFEHIFEAISVTTGIKYLALASYLEIYNEQIRDLLLPSDKLTSTPSLNLKETPNEGVTVPGLTIKAVHNVAECEDLLNVGSKNRIIGSTLMNQSSSRSHSIFSLSLEQISRENNNEESCIRKGKLNLVDLAGSERQTKTGATGDRLKEATKINLSLSALGNVISALVDGKARHIPYRDSKLTRLLQDSLGGNTRTLMIACISPSDRDYIETLSTLRYANRAKNISNKPKVNEDPKDTILRQYQEEIQRLKEILEKIPIQNNTQNNIDVKKEILIQNYEEEMDRLRNLHKNEQSEKENVLKQIKTIKDEYEKNLKELNEKNFIKVTSKEEILNRIQQLKSSMIGGEKSDDKELSERRKRKKLISERRLSAIAHVLAKIDMNEDREILQNQYKDIAQELDVKSDVLRRYRHKVRSLEKEIKDIQSEFEAERSDYLETIRKQEKNIKLLAQISEKIALTLKKECNYRNLENIKEEAVWLEDAQKFKLPELVVERTKLPPAGRFSNIQTAPARLDSGEDDQNLLKIKKLEKCNPEDLIGNYFRPKRATELLNESSRIDTQRAFDLWRDTTIPEFAKSKHRSTERLNLNEEQSTRPGKNHFWVTESDVKKKPIRLDALPRINFNKSRVVKTLDLL
nr:kinesin-like protein KIF17 isoform X2 [Onthophagus taurus]